MLKPIFYQDFDYDAKEENGNHYIHLYTKTPCTQHSRRLKVKITEILSLVKFRTRYIKKRYQNKKVYRYKHC